MIRFENFFCFSDFDSNLLKSNPGKCHLLIGTSKM